MTTMTETRAQKAVRVTWASRVFDGLAGTLVQRVRQAMSVPDNSDEETESQFRALRERLDAFFPEFRELYGALLIEQLGEQHADSVLSGLEAPLLQSFFRASEGIEAELATLSDDLLREMAEFALELQQTALAS